MVPKDKNTGISFTENVYGIVKGTKEQT